jgi:hypothetical protein
MTIRKLGRFGQWQRNCVKQVSFHQGMAWKTWPSDLEVRCKYVNSAVVGGRNGPCSMVTRLEINRRAWYAVPQMNSEMDVQTVLKWLRKGPGPVTGSGEHSNEPSSASTRKQEFLD